MNMVQQTFMIGCYVTGLPLCLEMEACHVFNRSCGMLFYCIVVKGLKFTSTFVGKP